MVSGCDSVGIALASYIRVPNSNPVIGKTFILDIYLFFTVNCIEKTKIKKKRHGMARFYFKRYNFIQLETGFRVRV